jgi:hypothetical protein
MSQAMRKMSREYESRKTAIDTRAELIGNTSKITVK